MNILDSVTSGNAVVALCSNTLKYNDRRLVDHGIRVGYIAGLLANSLKSATKTDAVVLFLLSVFHDIGAYKTEEIGRMVKFETEDVHAHSVYGYLFLKYLTPLSRYSKAVLFHHYNYSDIPKDDALIIDYSQIINLADRIDIGLLRKFSINQIIDELSSSDSIQSKYIDAMMEVFDNDLIDPKTWNEDSKAYRDSLIESMELSADDVESFIMMMVYNIDFKSPATMLHSVNTTSVSLFLANKLNLDENQTSELYFASLVHDIGKLTTPVSILESSVKLNDDEMKVMKLHATGTEQMLEGVFKDNIIRIAASHHEKLDGTGYPHGLTKEQMPLSYRIIAVADITSALTGRRSYKDMYSWDKTINILLDMANLNKIDPDIVNIIAKHHMELQDFLDERAAPVAKLYKSIVEEYSTLLEKHDAPEIFFG